MVDEAQAGMSRRNAMRTVSGGALVLAGLAGMAGKAFAQEATPQVGEGLKGAYAVVRVRRVRPEFSAEELARTVAEGFVPIVREVPGFVSYFVVADEEQRSWVSIGIFANKSGRG